jgi:hypothetical protein
LSVAAESLPPVTEATSHPDRQPVSKAWLLGPWADLLLVANLTWPVVFLVCQWGGLGAQQGVQFWQVYFVTMPHRWITLALVFLDGRQFRQAPRTYVAIACLAVLFCVAVRVGTGALTCLLVIDYVWNAWHFAAQHHGVLRIYGRHARPAAIAGLALEKVVMRAFLLYVILRVAGGVWSLPSLESWLATVDWVALAVPVFLLARELAAPSSAARGKLIYLASVMTLYVLLLLAVHYQLPKTVLALATASALFHATEYLALVTWAVRRKHGPASGTSGLMPRLAAEWGLTLAAFATVLGFGGWIATSQGMQWWLLVNVIVAYLHYAYDGLIWKVRQPASYAN